MPSTTTLWTCSVYCHQTKKQGDYAPVAIVKHDDVRGRQVDTESTSTGSEQEDELLAARLVVLVDGNDTVFVCSATIDTTVLYRLVSRRAYAIRQKTHCIVGTSSNPRECQVCGSFG